GRHQHRQGDYRNDPSRKIINSIHNCPSSLSSLITHGILSFVSVSKAPCRNQPIAKHVRILFLGSRTAFDDRPNLVLERQTILPLVAKRLLLPLTLLSF